MRPPRPMRIAVTGAGGLLGATLCRKAIARGHDLVAYTRTTPTPLGAKTQFLDLTDRAATATAFGRERVDVVIHTAGLTDVDECERNPGEAERANVDATHSVVDAANAVGSRVVFVSTDYVFDGASGPYDEDAVPSPQSVYGTAKFAAERVVQDRSDAWAIARTCVLLGWPRGPRENFATWAIGRFSRGEPVPLFRDQWVTTTHTRNAAAMILEIAERGSTGVWHAAGGELADRVAFGVAMCAEFGFSPDLIAPRDRASAGLAALRPGRAGLRTARAARELTAQPWSLARALRCLHDEWRGTEGGDDALEE